ncbi:hypothetical protein Aca07nite_72310 [Actinoplanes capillaceus]|uniref:IclR helix-turn-helix domain-containing protein n=1 Tax=Actinoplanes campanulatus TaxID=113559 RepID=A0ABQ3WUI7_9ACTN|nr:helix-turn-helix transcriptional regulator [Actinoplanes capillaceus]GID49956.1 hypothetical protein Aca07nite_72310 [Actinoplanes capillaceus]
MDITSLSPAAQAVLRAVADLGQGNVHELATKSGKARSTTDKALKALADVGLIVAVDSDADTAEGTPVRYTLSDVAANELTVADFDDQSSADPSDEPDTTATEPPDTDDDQDGHDAEDQDDESGERGDADPNTSGQEDPGTTKDEPRAYRYYDRRIMAIKTVLAENGADGTTLDEIVIGTRLGHPTASRLLAAMEQADAARQLPGTPRRWIPGPTKAAEVNPDPKPPACPVCTQTIRGATVLPDRLAALKALTRPDGTLHVVDTDGKVHIITLPNGTLPRTPSKPSTVAATTAGMVNADGNEPFGRGELEKLVTAVLRDKPGVRMTPQAIATAISDRLGGRQVSSGAVRNNCTKLAGAGRILMASESPMEFQHPVTDSSEQPAPELDDTDPDREQPQDADQQADKS